MKKTKKLKKKLPKYYPGGTIEDPNVTGSNGYGMGQTNPYYKADIDAQNKIAQQQGNEAQMNAVSDQVIQKIPGFGQYYGMAKGASDMGRSMIGKDENGLAHSNMEQAADNFMNPTHQSIMANASKGQHGEAVMSAFINPAIGSIVGEVFKGTGFGDKATAYGRGEKVFSNGGQIEAAWGQPNAEVEKQENAITPNGQFVQYNGPSHEQGGIPTKLPGGTDVFSDRLKMPGTKKTFAKLNKPNDTTKEDKILSDNKSNTIAKATASLMKLAKQTNSDKLFQAQEALKQSKIEKYTMKLGGTVKYPEGGKVDAMGFPIDSTGRRLSTEEQLGFSRDLNPNRLYTSNYGASYNVPLTQAGTPLKTGTTTPTQPGVQPGFVYDPTLGSYDQQWNAHLKKVNLGSFAKGGRVPKYELGGNQRLKEINSEEPELLDPRDLGYANFQDWSDVRNAELKLDQDKYNQLNTEYKSPWDNPNLVKNNNTTGNKNSNWGNIATQAGLGIMNNLGNIYDLSRAKDVEVDKYDRMNPALLDPTASLRDADNAKKIAEYNIRNASVGHSGAYLANRVGSDVSLVLAKDKIAREYQNVNAGIKNNAQMYNIEQHKAEDIANMQNRAQSRNIKANAITNIGQNAVSQYGDTQKRAGDKDRIELIKSMYPSIKNSPEIMEYYKKKGWLTDDEIKELDRQQVSRK